MKRLSIIYCLVFLVLTKKCVACAPYSGATIYGYEIISIILACPLILLLKPFVTMIYHRQDKLLTFLVSLFGGIFTSGVASFYMVLLSIPEFGFFTMLISYFIFEMLHDDYVDTEYKIFFQSFKVFSIGFFGSLLSQVFFGVYSEDSSIAIFIKSIIYYIMFSYTLITLSVAIETKILQSFIKTKEDLQRVAFWSNSYLYILIFLIIALQTLPFRLQSSNGLIGTSVLRNLKFWIW